MRLAFVADGRSPIARSWIDYFVASGHEVHLLTTRACADLRGLTSQDIVPLWPRRRPAARDASGALRSQRNLGAVTTLRHWIGPLLAWRQAGVLRGMLHQINPDLVHALRIPFEGMLAAAASPDAPLVISTWGNDLTLHAPSTPIMRWATRRVLRRAAGLHADCARDERLARSWGLDPKCPGLVAPGNGGVRRETFRPGPVSGDPDFGVPSHAPIVVQPRGLRAYVRSESFFRALPRVLEAAPATVFLCPAMEGVAEAEGWKARLDLGPRLRLLPPLDPGSMAALFRRASVSVSPSTHDGTPNTLLEAMACGCLPIAGDLESIREWIHDGENGLLVDPRNPQALADAVERGLKDDALRARARQINGELVATRADYDEVMPRAESFYAQVLRARDRR
ncbi:MAG TPA: glycosyltransferase family 4 protein [Anaerolineales bacterium]|nr:glycosyltransferase family 4 protein [Anaerolineales bacterium]